jgi:outer membrane protein assembly factor BamB
MDGHLYAVNPDGTQKWAFDYGGSVGTHGSPAIGADGTIYVGGDEHLYAVTPHGMLKWIGPSLGYGKRVPAVGPDGTIYTVRSGIADDHHIESTLYALDPDGTMKWSLDAAAPEGTDSSPSIGPNGRLYLASGQVVRILDPDGSELQVSEPCFGSPMAPAVALDGSFYTPAYTHLCAFSPDGSLRWEFIAERWLTYFPAIADDGTIYVASHRNHPNDSTLYAINPDGTQRWAFQIEAYNMSAPVIGADGTVYFGATDNRLYALNPDGTVKWSYEADGDVASPAIGADGTLYVTSNDGYLYAFGP